MTTERGALLRPEEKPFDRIVRDCCQELLVTYGLLDEAHASSVKSAPREVALCGMMSFRGQQLRGSVVLTASNGVLNVSCPAGAASQCDWICELANQLAGRVKNRLLARGIEIQLATPVALNGQALRPLTAKRRDCEVFAGLGGTFCVWADYELTAGFSFPLDAPSGCEPVIAEGETLLF